MTHLRHALNVPCLQQEFADAVGISPARVSTLIAEGVLPADAPAGVWLEIYCARLREQAAGRGQELTIERAALAREQRIGQAIKNGVALGSYAPIGLLTDVLASASAAVASRLEAVPVKLRKAAPDLTQDQLEQIEKLLSAARAEWVSQTVSLVAKRVEELADEAELSDDEGDELVEVG